MIYLDNAATTRQKPQPVIDAVVSAMTTLGNSARGTHEGSLSASRMIYGTREKLATFFNCPRPDHVVFTANSTEALNMAICGLLDPGDHVIATDLEHNSVLRPLYRLEAARSGSLSFVPAGRRGRVRGLSLCRSIVTAHGGEISVQDHQPHGSVFRFTLRASEVKMYE